MTQPISREVEGLRNNVLADPLKVLEIGQGLMTEFGVTADYATEPEQYIREVRMTDPRYINSKGEARNISRQDVNTKAHTMTDDVLTSGVMFTADRLGILTPSYPFDEFATEVDRVVITGGLVGSLRDRTEFAINSIESPDMPIVIVGGNRPTQKAEADKLEEEGKNPFAYPTEQELAAFVAEELSEKYPEQNIINYSIRTSNPQNIDTIRETFLSNPKIGKLALITTALYVPFTTMDAQAVVAELGGSVQARVYAGESNPTAVKSRKVDTYRSEVARTLIGAARWHIAQTQRTLK